MGTGTGKAGVRDPEWEWDWDGEGDGDGDWKGGEVKPRIREKGDGIREEEELV